MMPAFTEAYYLFVDDAGELVGAGRGGHPIKIGITIYGAVHLVYEAPLIALGPVAVAELARLLLEANGAAARLRIQPRLY